MTMKTLALSLCLLAARADKWDALSQIESGNRDAAIGPRGEVSRFQVMPRVWRANGGGNPLDSRHAQEVAGKVMQPRVDAFQKRTGRAPTNAEWWLLWHCPGRLVRGKVTRADMAAAQRFSNLNK